LYNKYTLTKKILRKQIGRAWWLKPIILAVWEAEIGRILISGQPRQKLHELSSQPTAG
jgi:hypothetical protein